MAMSRKHYAAIAAEIKDVTAIYGPDQNSVMDRNVLLAMKAVAGRLAVIMQIDNERFDRDKFMEACGF